MRIFRCSDTLAGARPTSVTRAPAAGAHRAQQAAQLGHGLAPRALDRAQRSAGLIGPFVEDVVGCRGLNHDHGDAVSDHGVQLSGDVRPLVAHCAAGFLLDGRAAVACRLAQRPGPHRQAHREDGVLDGGGQEVARHQGDERREADEGHPRRPRGRQRADREQPRHRQHHLGGEQQDPQSSGQGHRHHKFGVAAPPPQGSALDDAQGDPEKDEGRGIVVLALLQDDQHQEQAHPPGDGHVRDSPEKSAGGPAHAIDRPLSRG